MMEIRPFKVADTASIMQLFYDTVHRVNCRDYRPEQLNVWAPQQMDEAQWRSRLGQCLTLVAEQNAKIVGFCELEADGHIGCFYCHYQHQHQGIGSMLLQEVEAIAQHRNLPKLFTEASITAKPFFEHRGFQTIQAQEVERSGIFLRNYIMEKALPQKPEFPWG